MKGAPRAQQGLAAFQAGADSALASLRSGGQAAQAVVTRIAARFDALLSTLGEDAATPLSRDAAARPGEPRH